ncbi:MAG: CAP domain-containing protein [Polyangia bacterium]
MASHPAAPGAARLVPLWGTLLGVVAGLVVPIGLIGSTGSIGSLAHAAAQQSTERSTRVVTAADGTVTTTVTEKVTRNGRTTVTTHTTVTGPGGGGAKPAAPPEPSPPPPRPPSPGGASGKSPSGPGLSREAVEAHNRERRRIGVGDLAWDAKLAARAQDWARHLCRGGKSPPSLQHRPSEPGGPGENLWEAVSTEPAAFPIGDAVKSWAGEQKFYDARSGRCRGGVCGHFTQLVWRGTTHVGCGVASCQAGGFTATIWACNYAPAGNLIGQRAY